MERRHFLQWGASALACAALPVLAAPKRGAAKVVVVGGGFGGATAAKYLKLWAPELDVTLVERNEAFVSCPQSNLVLGGSRSMSQLTLRYDALGAKYGVKVLRDEVTAVDSERKLVRLQRGKPLPYDRLILSPGIDFLTTQVEGLDEPLSQERILHAWKAGPQTVALRRQLEAMPNGGVYLLSIPRGPYRCPPGPYERVCQVAGYFKRHKPKSKIIVFDANPDIVAKKAIFRAAWDELYRGMVDYRPASEVVAVDGRTLTARTDFDVVRADVLNLIPLQRAGLIAEMAGVLDVDVRWATVDFLSYESRAVPGIHVVGDAVFGNPAPKSGHTANQQAKVAAAAVIALLRGETPYPDPVLANTCYSFLSDKEAAHVAAVYRYDKEKKGLKAAEDSFGVSEKRSQREGFYANAWARNIWADSLL